MNKEIRPSVLLFWMTAVAVAIFTAWNIFHKPASIAEPTAPVAQEEIAASVASVVPEVQLPEQGVQQLVQTNNVVAQTESTNTEVKPRKISITVAPRLGGYKPKGK